MSTIVVYKRNPANTNPPVPAERQAGMRDAGQMLRRELSDSFGAGNDTDAEDRVMSVLDDLIAEPKGMFPKVYDVRFEVKNGAIETSYKIDGAKDGKGRYQLIDAADARNTGKLLLDVGLDDVARKKNIFKMRMTVPRAAANDASWDYLSGQVNADLNEIEIGGPAPNRVQNYLIATFMFSRCR